MSPEELRNVANNCNVATNQAILIDDAADAWERDRAELERLRTNLADTTIAWEQDRAERDSLREQLATAQTDAFDERADLRKLVEELEAQVNDYRADWKWRP